MRRTPLTRKSPLRAKTGLKPGGALKTTKPLKAKAPMKSKAPPGARSKIRQSAKGEQCLVRIPGICNGNPESVVLAHLNGGGAGTKKPDYQGAYACFDCHNWLDGGYVQHGATRAERDLCHLEAIIRTQEKLVEKGLILIA